MSAAPAISPASVTSEAVAGLLQRWINLSELERQAFTATCQEVTRAAQLVDDSTSFISANVQRLASLAEWQNHEIAAAIDAANAIAVEGENLPLARVACLVSTILGEAAGAILTLRTHAMAMVAAQDEVMAGIGRSEQAVARIEAINSQTRFLALKALRDAADASEPERCFAAVAAEVQALSRNTDAAAAAIRLHITELSAGLRGSYGILEEIASFDMTRHAEAQDRLGAIMQALTAQNTRFNASLAANASRAREIASLTARLITGLQFQDRTAQSLAHVTHTLQELTALSGALREATLGSGLGLCAGIDQAGLERILARYSLASFRDRLAGQSESSHETAPPAAESGSIELF